MEYTRNITLDVNAVSAMTVVRAKEGDFSTRFINITLTEDHQKITLTDETVEFRCEKPDGKAVVNSGVIEDDGTVTVELTSQVTAVPGRCKADISVSKDGALISTANFCVEILESPDVANRALSSDQFGEFTRAIAEAAEVIDKAEEAIEEVKGIERKAIEMTLGTGWLGNGPYYQTVTVPGYTATALTQVDLMCESDVMDQLTDDGVDYIYILNNSGVLTAYAGKGKPSAEVTVQASVVETFEL